ncbi:MAG TPA: 2-oxo-4-hydroxy-4-carboxy-5-ureidoimidazoline decarboxylase [Terracidiphilus sp.]|nr:2-oxo-4-hydroxy-4-carboxy-5-ureidoimidazoline decarboxylase [Terracidiphilus sp.]
MNPVLAAWNEAKEKEAMEIMISCCGARRWAEEMTALRPIESIAALSEAADRVWSTMQEPDWLEAFACHPRIGEREPKHATNQSTQWSQEEQAGSAGAASGILAELAELNALYEQRFGFTYIVCATGKSGGEMLEILKRRIHSDRESELREAAEQQRKIMQIRLGKWLAS